MTGIVIPPLQAFFDFLATKSAYLELGLREFRRYDGEVLELEHDEVAADQFPALTVDSFEAENVALNQPAGQHLVEVRVELSLLYAATGHAGERAMNDCDEAAGTIFDLVSSRLAKSGGLASGGLIHAHDLRLSGFGPVREVRNGRLADIVFWKAGLELSLSQQRES